MWQVGGAWGEGAPFPIQEMVPLHLKRAINATYTTDTTLGEIVNKHNLQAMRHNNDPIIYD